MFDFNEIDQVEAWVVTNDAVMGGISQGTWYQEDDYVVFEGDVSLENNGGFSSVRVGFRPVDLSAYDGVVLRVRGDGQKYAFGLSDSNSQYQYRLTFVTTVSEEGEWSTFHIPFDMVIATKFGREVPMADPLNISRIRGMNLIISDKQEGPFRLEIKSISLYSETTEEKPLSI